MEGGREDCNSIACSSRVNDHLYITFKKRKRAVSQSVSQCAVGAASRLRIGFLRVTQRGGAALWSMKPERKTYAVNSNQTFVIK